MAIDRLIEPHHRCEKRTASPHLTLAPQSQVAQVEPFAMAGWPYANVQKPYGPARH